MSDRPHLASSDSQPRLHPRPHTKSEEPGLCALEDYTCLTGESFAMRSLRAQLRRAAPHFRIALIMGEPGTAKETVALALHRLTSESDATFLSHTSGSLLATLRFISMHSGYSAGPVRSQNTLFLADVDELTRNEQSELLQTLKCLSALRNGPERPRLIFATGRDLRSLSGLGPSTATSTAPSRP